MFGGRSIRVLSLMLSKAEGASIRQYPRVDQHRRRDDRQNARVTH